MSSRQFIASTLLLGPPSFGQSPLPPRVDGISTLTDSTVPPALRNQLRRLGGRLRNAESSRLVLAGQLQDSKGTRPLSVSWQVPGRFKIEEGGSEARVLGFDGAVVTHSRGPVTANETALLETLAQDLPESVLLDATISHSLRLISSNAKHSSGKFLTVFFLSPAPNLRRPIEARPRAIGWDAATQLLATVGYTKRVANREITVETLFEQWSDRGGQQFPGVIRRLEDGTERFRFTISQASVGGALPDTAFRP